MTKKQQKTLVLMGETLGQLADILKSLGDDEDQLDLLPKLTGEKTKEPPKEEPEKLDFFSSLNIMQIREFYHMAEHVIASPMAEETNRAFAKGCVACLNVKKFTGKQADALRETYRRFA